MSRVGHSVDQGETMFSEKTTCRNLLLQVTFSKLEEVGGGSGGSNLNLHVESICLQFSRFFQLKGKSAFRNWFHHTSPSNIMLQSNPYTSYSQLTKNTSILISRILPAKSLASILQIVWSLVGAKL